MKRAKGNYKIRTYLRVEKVVPTISKSGNNMLTVILRNRKNEEFRHYVSFNARSKVWTRQLLLGSGINYEPESLELDLICGQDPFEYCRGRLYECVFVFDKNFAYPIVNEIYSLEDAYRNKEKCIELYNTGWFKNETIWKVGKDFSLKDFAGEWYGKKEDTN